MKKVLVLGANGMLGRMVFDFLSKQNDIDLKGYVRKASKALELTDIYKKDFWSNENVFDFVQYHIANHHYDYIINCIGIVKPRVSDSVQSQCEEAVRINTLLPYELSKAVKKDTKIIQIATDCVYSGKEGGYVENSPHDPIDVYGKTKSLGEVTENIYHLRCSIIGPEFDTKYSFLEWVLSNPRQSTVKGFINHTWNGLTTLAFAKIVYVMMTKYFLDHSKVHLLPLDTISKHRMVTLVSQIWDRDLHVEPVAAKESINRTLKTSFSGSDKYWELAYGKIPTIEELFTELKNYKVSGV